MNRKGYILVVETDDLIRELLQRWLREGGYAVISGDCGPSRRDQTPLLVIANVPNPRTAQAF